MAHFRASILLFRRLGNPSFVSAIPSVCARISEGELVTLARCGERCLSCICQYRALELALFAG